MEVTERIYLSVIMCAYNEEKYLSAAIKSILNQTYPYFEFIIINDGSTDDSEKIINSFDDKRIVYKKIGKVNFSEALNTGLKLAKYDYIARMDADDISLPDRFEKQVNYLIKNPEVQVLSSGYALFKNESISHIYNLPENNTEIKEQLSYSSAVCHAGSVYLKRQILKFGGYNPNLDCLEDIDLWLRIRKYSTFHNLDDILYLIRIKENSMSSKEALKPGKFFEDIYIKNFDKGVYSDSRKADVDYALILFKFASKKEFRSYVAEKNVLSNPKIFLLYVWSFLPAAISSKNIIDWFKWKVVGLKTMFSKDKEKFQNLIISLDK